MQVVMQGKGKFSFLPLPALALKLLRLQRLLLIREDPAIIVVIISNGVNVKDLEILKSNSKIHHCERGNKAHG